MSLRDNLITLLNKYFYKKEEKPKKYKEWLTSQYENGTWYLGEYNNVFNQIQEFGEERTYITARYSSEIRGSSRLISLTLGFWKPTSNSFSYNQQVDISYVNETIDKSQSISLQDNGTLYLLSIPSSGGTVPDSVKNGLLTVTIHPYIDESTNNYYTGVSYKVNITDLTGSSSNFDIIEVTQ